MTDPSQMPDTSRVRATPAPILQSLSGIGVLTYPDDARVECAFRLTRRSAVGVALKCSDLPLEYIAGVALGGGPPPIRFRGESNSGHVVTIEHGMSMLDYLIDIRDTERSFLTYACTNSTVVAAPLKTAITSLQVSFALVNLVFYAHRPVDYADGRGCRLGLTSISLNGRTITLRQLDDYDARHRRLRTNGSNIITTVAEAIATDRDDLLSLVEQIDRMSSLLTLGTGNSVSWATYTARDATTGHRVCTETRHPPSKSYGGLPLAPRASADFKAFIESTYPAYCERAEIYQLARVAHARVDAVVGGFLETRALLTCVLIEFLANAYASHNGYTAPVSSERFTAILPKLRTQVRDSLVALLPGVDTPTIERMVNGVSRFNDAGLRDRLRFTARGLDTGISDDDIKAVLATRQKLAHQMTFGSQRAGYWNEYRRALHVADRIVLRLLDYVGPYTNVETLDRAFLGATEA